MKKIIIFLIIAVLIAGAVSAQPIRDQRNPVPKENLEQLSDTAQSGSRRARETRSVSVEGVLKLEKGFVAVESDGTVYYIPMLNRYIGFITGLREGERVSVEGYEFRNLIRPVKVTIAGKSYDFMSWNHGQGSCHGFGKRDFRPDNRRRAPRPR
jgi:hypothetical protein